MILIIFHYNDNYKNKADSICSCPGNIRHVLEYKKDGGFKRWMLKKENAMRI